MDQFHWQSRIHYHTHMSYCFHQLLLSSLLLTATIVTLIELLISSLLLCFLHSSFTGHLLIQQVMLLLITITIPLATIIVELTVVAISLMIFISSAK